MDSTTVRGGAITVLCDQEDMGYNTSPVTHLVRAQSSYTEILCNKRVYNSGKCIVRPGEIVVDMRTLERLVSEGYTRSVSSAVIGVGFTAGGRGVTDLMRVADIALALSCSAYDYCPANFSCLDNSYVGHMWSLIERLCVRQSAQLP